MSCGSGGSNSRLAKAAGAEPCGQMRKNNCTPLWREAKVKMYKTHHSGALLEVEMSKKCTPLWWEAHSKSKFSKHTRIGAFLEVVMSKKCMLLWREAHFQVKMYKTPQCETAFGSSDVEKVHAVAARSTFPSQKCYVKTDGLGPLLDVQMSFRVAGPRDCAPCQK